MAKDVIQTIKDRASIRAYQAQEVPDETLEKILEAAHLAPSAGNIQPWEFYVIKNQAKIEKLAEIAYGQEWMTQAPIVVVVCTNPDLSAAKYGQRGEELYALQDTSAAIENMLLAAEAYDLGSCWIGAFDEQQVKEVLELPAELIPLAFVTIGYPQGDQEEVRPQKELDKVTTIIN
ncbi:nitroreductase family protein [Natroniella acetigena]|uniref:nitroreductase family protein n=1 Tax=Natroniella acetigena TaxID=52004 RepID=UPI00200A2CD9|nr:nitroreductase family protein [Natroniella acetigena]MCK8826891.1 nitroreductase family protein [Natroniella acetigena]